MQDRKLEPQPTMTPPVANDPQPQAAGAMQAMVAAHPPGLSGPLPRPDTRTSNNSQIPNPLTEEEIAMMEDQAPPSDDDMAAVDNDAIMSDGDEFYTPFDGPQDDKDARTSPPSYTPTLATSTKPSMLTENRWMGSSSNRYELIPASVFPPDPNWPSPASSAKSTETPKVLKMPGSHNHSSGDGPKKGGSRPGTLDGCVMCQRPTHYPYNTCSIECSKRLDQIRGQSVESQWKKPLSGSNRQGQSSSSSYWNWGSRLAPIKMCEVCKARPQYQKGGKTYPTCGLTCATKYNPHNVDMCDFCKQRPKLVVNGKLYPQCGKTCRDKARAAATAAANSAAGSCTTCLICWRATAHTSSKEGYCSKICEAIAEAHAPFLIELPRGHVAFKQAADMFSTAWKRMSVPCPVVRKIYRVRVKSSFQAEYDAYRSQVNSHGFFKSKGNEQVRFIGTHRDCTIGDAGTVEPCSSAKCLYCSVIQRNVSKEHFPSGIITAPLERAVETASNVKKRSSKAVLMTHTLVGKSVKMGMTELVDPPAGIDSVQLIGYQPHGGRLDLGEVLVFTTAAVKPLYIITFE